MPTYEYKCASCSRIEDIFHGINEKHEGSCICGGKMNKTFSSVGISFKGSGFYSNDSKGRNK
jgi:putative FmdB family regulatory protein